MNIKIFAAVVGFAVSSCAISQNAAIDIPDFRPLEAKAKDSVNITLGPWVLHSMGAFLDEKDPEGAATKKLLGGIQSIQIRSFEFETDSAYSHADIDAVRRQLKAPGWTSLMNVHDRDKGEDVDMYLLIQNEQTRGFALVASEPRQFTIINIVGSINVKDLPKLQSQLHLGKLMPGQDGIKWPAAAQL
jgi:Domain of unknown function (DUF4252)